MIDRPIAKRRLTSIELFAGCGGPTLGLHRAGWKGLFAVERDPMAFETLKANLIDESAPYSAFTRWPEWMPRKSTDLVALLGDNGFRARLRGLRGTGMGTEPATNTGI